jgi:drug/metabolite transporter (DMT)-like permease
MAKQPRYHPAGPHLALFAVQMIFGTWGIPAKIALRLITPFSLSAIRVAIAAATFATIGRVSGNFKPIRRPHWLLLIASALLGIVFNQWLFVTGLKLTTVVNTVLITTTMPVFTLVVSAIAGTERPSLRRLIGILLAAAGVVYLISPARADVTAGSRFGDLLVLASALLYGAYIAISKALVTEYGALPTITWIFVLATVPTVPVGIVSSAHVSFAAMTTGTWAAIIYIVIVPTVMAYYLNAWALNQVPPSTVAVYIYFQPLIAFLVAPAILGEAFTWHTAVAAALVLTGVAITARRRGQQVVRDAELKSQVRDL